jgi:hypothetical protein
MEWLKRADQPPLCTSWWWKGLRAKELEITGEKYTLRHGGSRDEEFVQFRERRRRRTGHCSGLTGICP